MIALILYPILYIRLGWTPLLPSTNQSYQEEYELTKILFQITQMKLDISLCNIQTKLWKGILSKQPKSILCVALEQNKRFFSITDSV